MFYYDQGLFVRRQVSNTVSIPRGRMMAPGMTAPQINVLVGFSVSLPQLLDTLYTTADLGMHQIGIPRSSLASTGGLLMMKKGALKLQEFGVEGDHVPRHHIIESIKMGDGVKPFRYCVTFEKQPRHSVVDLGLTVAFSESWSTTILTASLSPGTYIHTSQRMRYHPDIIGTDMGSKCRLLGLLISDMANVRVASNARISLQDSDLKKADNMLQMKDMEPRLVLETEISL
ncbi:hypothetical protein QFC20_001060 [Naganishia adeliensis]|uniref:Uncharacterized protein n=1 Tax=Naganishia adeliensis TaxID=92952 RepID=A0ACC2WTV4_9TREE|nr:hypothetical protein QFC20_001060 [Naganishia adeliensis]